MAIELVIMIFGALFYFGAWIGITIAWAVYITEKEEASWKWRISLTLGLATIFGLGVGVAVTGMFFNFCLLFAILGLFGVLIFLNYFDGDDEVDEEKLK